MNYNHEVIDTDAHYKIDGLTRTITNINEAKRMLVQNDHNSERLTFEVPRFFDGHDFSKCNLVQIHYINYSSSGLEQSPGIYEVEDLHVSAEKEDVVLLSWLVSGVATKYVGMLNFAIRFLCVAENGDIEYAWNTTTFEGIEIKPALCNSDEIGEQYADVLLKWKNYVEHRTDAVFTKEIVTGEEIDKWDVETSETMLPKYVYEGSVANFRQDGNAYYNNAPFDTALIFTLAQHVLGNDEAILGWGLPYTQVAISSYGADGAFIWTRNIHAGQDLSQVQWTLVVSKARDEASLVGSIEIDTELNENSDNAIANSAVTKALNGKINKSELVSMKSFKWTDFEVDAGQYIASECVFEDALSVLDPITIRCAGKTLGFTFTVSGDSDTVYLTINGKREAYANYSTVTVPVTYMEQDIIFEGIFSWWQCSDMQCEGVNIKAEVDPAVIAAALANKRYKVSCKAYGVGFDLEMPSNSFDAEIIIDPFGNFVIDLGNLDNMAGFECAGIVVNGAKEVIDEFKLTNLLHCPAVFSTADAGLTSNPFACGCRVSLGIDETSQLNISFGDTCNSCVSPNIGVNGAVTGKMFLSNY